MANAATPWGLLAWIGAAVVAFAVAPAPPAAPPMDAEEIAAIQRSLDRLVAETRAWQRERGDRQLPWSQARGHLAIVIDDVGRELHLFEQLLDLRYPITFSVLPGAVYAPGAQLRLRADRRRYREIMLHLPMEPLESGRMRETEDARETFLLSSDPPDELVRKLEAALDRVPAAVGVNNHMGSRLSAERAAMDALMPVLAQRGLFLLDSRTTPATVAEQAARHAGVPAIARQVFLDDDPDPAAIEAALERAATMSRERPVVAIGHPLAATVDVLRRRLLELYEAGVSVYLASVLLTHAGSAQGRASGP
ncbi:MAG: divergent polysaccharide deacetylase family protein [Nannocystaceae bacterium]